MHGSVLLFWDSLALNKTPKAPKWEKWSTVKQNRSWTNTTENHNVSLEISNLEDLYRLNVEGIILVATEVTKEHKDFVRRSKIPVLFIGQVYDEAYCIINDEEKAGQTMENI